MLQRPLPYTYTYILRCYCWDFWGGDGSIKLYTNFRKIFLWTCRCKETLPSLNHFLRILVMKYETEKHIYFKLIKWICLGKSGRFLKKQSYQIIKSIKAIIKESCFKLHVNKYVEKNCHYLLIYYDVKKNLLYTLKLRIISVVTPCFFCTFSCNFVAFALFL